MGVFEEGSGEVYDIEVSRSQPSLQLVGRPDHSSLDLPILQERGVRLVGKVKSAEGRKVSFSDDLVAFTAAADAKLASLLGRIDGFISRNDLESEAGPKEPFSPFFWPVAPPSDIDLRIEGIKTVLWATGFRRSYPWLKIPVLDQRGEIRHSGGITAVPGLYVLGLQFLRTRKSAFIDGVGDDAVVLADRISNRSAIYRNSAA
jgi:putative flavoprotein involved in K+ transport